MPEMARMFLGRNRSTPVTAFERFGVAVTAGYPTEGAITKIVESLGLKIGYPKTEGNGLFGGVRCGGCTSATAQTASSARSAYCATHIRTSPAGLGRQASRRSRDWSSVRMRHSMTSCS